MKLHEQLGMKDNVEINIVSNVAIPERKPYQVINGLFKNGKEYKPGETIMLDEKTAANFLTTNDIKQL